MKTCFFGFGAILLLAGAAQANVINVQYTGLGAGSNVRVASPSTNGNVFAGQLRHTLSGGTGEAGAYNGNWLTYCTDLSQRVTSSTRAYEVVSLAQLPDSEPMGALKANAIRSVYTAANSSQSRASTSDNLAAAFQLAIWEIVTDFNPAATGSGLDLTSGSFRATKTDGSALGSGVQSELSWLLSAASLGAGGEELVGLRSGQYQDQILPLAVPAPGAAALASLGVLCLTGRRRGR